MTSAEDVRNSDLIHITEKIHEDVVQISLEGRFDANTCRDVEKFIRQKIEKGAYRFVLDMEKVSFIASAGLRIVLVFAKELRRKHEGGDLRISEAQEAVVKVFTISGLHNVMKFFEHTDEAVRSFAN
jgi:anti-anti-sigma factor